MRWRPPYLSGLFGISAICGIIDAACFIAMGGVFAELMTGNMVLLGFRLGTGEDFGNGTPARYLAALAFFALGALLGGHVMRGPRVFTERRFGFFVELAILVVATVVAVVTDPGQTGWDRDVVVALLCVAMGLQNTLLRTHGVPDLATNVMTLTFTALVSDSALARGHNERWRRRGGSIALFIVGATVGAWLTRYGAWPPLVLATALFAAVLWPLLASDPPPRTPASPPGPRPGEVPGAPSTPGPPHPA
ncbi:YoaK family protein [Rhabdothermincola salaria]|uniref:YoaK family protein n=1 Tax=Rhabdothermincola salaria TaxID=2903142 RepID=UPI001E5B16F3|nr:DUF1275 domain-containing protein [Rhabdothermincola salaria]